MKKLFLQLLMLTDDHYLSSLRRMKKHFVHCEEKISNGLLLHITLEADRVQLRQLSALLPTASYNIEDLS